MNNLNQLPIDVILDVLRAKCLELKIKLAVFLELENNDMLCFSFDSADEAKQLVDKYFRNLNHQKQEKNPELS